MKLGKLKRIDLRSVWANEAADFTNWLAREENLALLSDKIGIGIKLVKTEAGVGPFSADILAEEENTNRKIIIENQLEATDHDHLGKLLTYASGHDAAYVIWIVGEVREEHKKAIDWLNEKTEEDLSFFLVQAEVLQIEDSICAPDFDVVSQPNDWAKAMRRTASGELSETKLLQLEYWDKFKAYAQAKGTKLRLRKTFPQHWYDVSIGSSACHIALIMNTRDALIECGIWIGDSKETYKQLHEKKDVIEKELGERLEWLEMPDRKASRIRIVHEIDVNDLGKWDQCFEWTLRMAEKFCVVFSNHF
jgi:hypothetical protein